MAVPKKDWKLKIKRGLSEECIECQAFVNSSGKDIQKGTVIHWLCFMSNASHMRYATISLGCEAHLHDICLYRLHLFLPVFCTVKGTHSFLNRQHVAIFMS